MRPFSLSITVDILDVGSRLRQVLLENFGPTLVHFMRTLGCAPTCRGRLDRRVPSGSNKDL
jgi:hypothetical protein